MASNKTDFKKTDKKLYQPKTVPMLIDVPKMNFIMLDGSGDPNEAPYAKAVEAMYAVAYTISMSAKKGMQPDGFFEYVVPPLEGLWWTDGAFDLKERDNWLWTSMIRQPEFVTPAVLDWAKETAAKKKPKIDVSAIRLEQFEEGLCVQMMHIGPYAAESESMKIMQDFMAENGLKDVTSDVRKHHEIYLSDPRKTVPEKCKTVLRHPVEQC